MVLNNVDPKPIPDDNSTVYTAITPPETIAGDLLDKDYGFGDAKSNSSVPWPGSTFIIRSVSSGEVITLLDGKIKLTRPGGRGSIHWECVESKGWLGFRSPISGKYLGHDDNSKVLCRADRHQEWENFCPRLRPEGGYVLMMTHYERLWHVGIKKEKGADRLAKLGDGGSEGIVWEFVKV